MGPGKRHFFELTFERTDRTAPPESFVLEPQNYTREAADGPPMRARFEWTAELLKRLVDLQNKETEETVRSAVGLQLRDFLHATGWDLPEAELAEAEAPEGGPHCLTIRASAAELYALPWEVMPLSASGRRLAELPNVLVRYEWPELRALPARGVGDDRPPRLVFAWSAAGGAVPAEEHGDWIRRSLQGASVPGVTLKALTTLANVSATALEEELSKNSGPTVVHLLCHGKTRVTKDGPVTELVLNDGAEPSERQAVGVNRLCLILERCTDLRLVVLCVCLSGDNDPTARMIGSLAQGIHRRSAPAVVASRYPLSTDGSVRLTRVLYRALLEGGASLESALVKARRALLTERGVVDAGDAADTYGSRAADAYALQLYERTMEEAKLVDGGSARVARPGFYPFGRRAPRPTPPPEKAAAPPRAPSTLPAKPRFFVGRVDESRTLVDALLACTPTVLLGPAGIGKSTLTLMGLYDARVEACYRERRYFARLDAARTANDMAGAIRSAMGLPIGPDPRGDVLAALARGPAALALDNAETPWDSDDRAAVEEFLDELLGIEGVALVVSIRGEARPAPLASATTIALEGLSPDDAKKLFCRIARPKNEDDPALDPLLAKMGGVPLAVTLLAHVGEGAPLASLSKRWDETRTALLKRPGIKEDRLSSWAVSLELSWASPRMTEPAKRLARLLGALPDGVALDDLDALLPQAGHEGALLLSQVGLAYSEADRLKTLPPVREHLALEHAAEGDDLRRMMEFYGELAKTLGPKVLDEGGREAVVRLRPEVGNLEAMIDRGLEGDEVDRWIDRAMALANLARATGLLGSAVLERAQDAAQQKGDLLRQANCLFHLGVIALDRSQHDEARSRFEQALPLYTKVGHVPGEANCIQSLGIIALARSLHDDARSRFEQALPLYTKVGHVLGEASCIMGLGDIALARSLHDDARSRYEQALPLYTKVGDVLGEANCILRLGESALARSLHDDARSRFEQALPLYTKVGHVLGEASCIMGLGDIALARSLHDDARSRFEQALPLYTKVGDVLGEANCIQSLGDIALARSQHDEARSRFHEALKLYARIPEPHSMGLTYWRLARLASDPREKNKHIEAAREAWTSIHRPDLVAKLDAEFGPPR